MKQNTGPFTQYIPADQLERNKFGQDDDELNKTRPGVGITSALLLGNVAVAIKAVFFGTETPAQATNSPTETGEEEPSPTRAIPENYVAAEEAPVLREEPAPDALVVQKLNHATPALQVLVVGDRMLPFKPLVGSGTAPTLLETPLSNVVSLSNAARPWVPLAPLVEPDAQVGGRGRTGDDSDRERHPPVPLPNRTPTNMSSVVLGSILLDQAVILYPRDLLSQSRDADDDALTITDLRASSGILQQRVDGSWLYIPEEGRLGDQVFTYRVSDGVASVEQTGVLNIAEPTGITLVGTSAADRLNGTLYADRIDGVGGNDLIFGRSGNDILVGGAGNDTIFGGDGNDLIYGGEGDDVLLGEAGDDVIYGEAGQDFLDGGDGNDVLSGGEGSDVLSGAAGNDVLLGGAGDDQLDGGSDNDFLDGGEGADSLQGGSGDDTMVGGGHNDIIHGGDGNDRIVMSATSANGSTVGYIGGGGNAQNDTSSTPAEVKSLNLAASADVLAVDEAGDTVTYSYSLTNTGTQAISGIVLTDDNGTAGNTGDDLVLTLGSGDADGDSQLDVDETWAYETTRTVTAADIEAGIPLVNRVTAVGTDANSASDSVSIAIDPTGSLTGPSTVSTNQYLITHVPPPRCCRANH